MAIKIKYAQLTIRDYKDPVYSNCVLIIEIVHSKLVLSTSSKLLNLKKNILFGFFKAAKESRGTFNKFASNDYDLFYFVKGSPFNFLK